MDFLSITLPQSPFSGNDSLKPSKATMKSNTIAALPPSPSLSRAGRQANSQTHVDSLFRNSLTVIAGKKAQPDTRPVVPIKCILSPTLLDPFGEGFYGGDGDAEALSSPRGPPPEEAVLQEVQAAVAAASAISGSSVPLTSSHQQPSRSLSPSLSPSPPRSPQRRPGTSMGESSSNYNLNNSQSMQRPASSLGLRSPNSSSFKQKSNQSASSQQPERPQSRSGREKSKQKEVIRPESVSPPPSPARPSSCFLTKERFSDPRRASVGRFGEGILTQSPVPSRYRPRMDFVTAHSPAFVYHTPSVQSLSSPSHNNNHNASSPSARPSSRAGLESGRMTPNRPESPSLLSSTLDPKTMKWIEKRRQPSKLNGTHQFVSKAPNAAQLDYSSPYPEIALADVPDDAIRPSVRYHDWSKNQPRKEPGSEHRAGPDTFYYPNENFVKPKTTGSHVSYDASLDRDRAATMAQTKLSRTKVEQASLADERAVLRYPADTAFYKAEQSKNAIKPRITSVTMDHRVGRDKLSSFQKQMQPPVNDPQEPYDVINATEKLRRVKVLDVDFDKQQSHIEPGDNPLGLHLEYDAERFGGLADTYSKPKIPIADFERTKATLDPGRKLDQDQINLQYDFDHNKVRPRSPAVVFNASPGREIPSMFATRLGAGRSEGASTQYHPNFAAVEPHSRVAVHQIGREELDKIERKRRMATPDGGLYEAPKSLDLIRPRPKSPVKLDKDIERDSRTAGRFAPISEKKRLEAAAKGPDSLKLQVADSLETTFKHTPVKYFDRPTSPSPSAKSRPSSRNH